MMHISREGEKKENRVKVILTEAISLLSVRWTNCRLSESGLLSYRASLN